MAPPVPQPLPWLLVEDYADRLAVAPDARATLHHVVSALDARWMEAEMRRIKADLAAQPPGRG